MIRTVLWFVTILICSTISLTAQSAEEPPLSRCDVLVYGMSGEGHQHLLRAFHYPGIAFDPSEQFIADFKKAGVPEDSKKAGVPDDLVAELRKAGRSTSQPRFTCNNNLYAHVAAATALYNSNRPSRGEAPAHLREGGEKEWRAALALQPKNPLLHVGLSMTLVSSRWADAVAEAQNAIALNPDLSAAHTQVGAALTMFAYQGGATQENLELARKEYETAVRLDPENCYVHANFGVTLVALKDYADAEKQADTAEQQCPKRTFPMYVRANSLAEQGKRKEAIAHLRSAVDIQPNNCLLWMYMIDLLKQEGDTGGAIKASFQAAQHCQ